MGLLDRFVGGAEISFTEGQAILGLMISIVGADGSIDDDEIEALNGFVQRLPKIRRMGRGEFSEGVDKSFRVLRRSGPTALMEQCARSISSGSRGTAFSIAVDLAFADGTIEREESAMLEQMATMLAIPADLAARIVEVIALKNGV